MHALADGEGDVDVEMVPHALSDGDEDVVVETDALTDPLIETVTDAV